MPRIRITEGSPIEVWYCEGNWKCLLTTIKEDPPPKKKTEWGAVKNKSKVVKDAGRDVGVELDLEAIP